MIVRSQHNLLLGRDEPLNKRTIVKREPIAIQCQDPRPFGELGYRRKKKRVVRELKITRLPAAAKVDRLGKIKIGRETFDLNLPARSVSRSRPRSRYATI